MRPPRSRPQRHRSARKPRGRFRPEASPEERRTQLASVNLFSEDAENVGRLKVIPFAIIQWAAYILLFILILVMSADMFFGSRLIKNKINTEIDTKNTMIFGDKRLVAVMGVQDLVIVDTEDVVMECSRDREQDVKRLVELLKQTQQERLI